MTTSAAKSILIALSLFCCFLSPAHAATSDVTLLPVSIYGQPLKGCVVTEFRYLGDRPRELMRQFHGLEGREIPFGEYQTILQCDDIRLARRFIVNKAQQLEVVAQFLGIRHEGVGPALVIEIASNDEEKSKYWVQLLGIYSDFRSSSGFDNEAGEIRLSAPPSGAYILLLLSTSGGQCVKEVDLVDATRHWVVHPSTCTVETDRYAHIVVEEDKRTRRRGPWYLDREKDWQIFERQLREAGEARKDP